MQLSFYLILYSPCGCPNFNEHIKTRGQVAKKGEIPRKNILLHIKLRRLTLEGGVRRKKKTPFYWSLYLVDTRDMSLGISYSKGTSKWIALFLFLLCLFSFVT